MFRRLASVSVMSLSCAVSLIANPATATTDPICSIETNVPASQPWTPSEQEWTSATAKTETMTLEQLAGASMIVRYSGRDGKRSRSESAKNKISFGKQQVSRAMPTIGASGTVLFTDNARSARQAYLQAKAFGSVMPSSFFTAVSQEGGPVNRLSGDIEPPVSAHKIGRRADPKLAAENAFMSARQLRAARVGLVFAPSADVLSQYTPASMRPRLFSYNSKLVGQLVAAQIAAYNSQGVMSVVHHFPGIGAIPRQKGKSSNSYKYDLVRLCTYELAPFRKAIEAGAPAIMVGHGTYPGLTTAAASGSRRVITDLLRSEMKFAGIIMTDSMTMKTARTGLSGNENLYTRSLAAGADLVLTPGNALKAKKQILEALKTGELSVQERRESIARVLAYRSAQLRVIATLKRYKPGSEFLLAQAQWFAYELRA